MKAKALCLAAALLLLAALPARATILAIGGEDINTVFQGTVTVSTNTAFFDNILARDALQLSLSGSTTIPPPNRIDKPFSAASSDFWVTADYYAQTAIGTASNIVWFGFTDGGTTRLLLRGTGVAQQIKLTTRDNAGTPNDIAVATGSICQANHLCTLNIHIVYGTSGSVDVYNNGTNILSFSGDVTTNSATALDKMYLGTTTNTVHSMYWSQIVVADEDTRSFRLLSCPPQGAAGGGRQSWPGAAAANINEVTIADGTFNSTASSPARSNWTMCPLPGVMSSIKNIHTCSRVARGGSGPQSWRHSLYSGGASADSGSDITTATSFQNDCHNWGGTDPNSGLPWSRGGFSSMEAGVLSKP